MGEHSSFLILIKKLECSPICKFLSVENHFHILYKGPKNGVVRVLDVVTLDFLTLDLATMP